MNEFVPVLLHDNDASRILVEEIEARTGLRLPLAENAPEAGAFIAVGSIDDLAPWREQLCALPEIGAEGFRLLVLSREPLQVVICGKDKRGCLYGCGQLLRKLSLLPGSIQADESLVSLSVTPKYPLRGHQLAYRDKQNTCPNWTVKDFAAYIRTLALFGANAIEILPPRTDDRLFSPLFHMHPMDMMAELSEVIHGLGLDVWMWYPNLGEDYRDPKIFARELAEREEVFSKLPYLDAILIPAGDPGELQPRELFEVCGKMMAVAHRYHPNAKVFVAPQVFAPEYDWYDAFYQEVSREPDWLYGLCYAPWIRDTLPEMAARLPEKYRGRIRHYPDITHTAACQFEVPLWDSPLAMLNGRESCCPRPVALKMIHNLHAPYCIGSVTYCEGIHDDVDKFLWTDQDVDPTRSSESLVRDYVRLLIDPEHVDELTRLIFALEENWQGELASNETIDKTLAGFEALNETLRDEVKTNWRYAMLYQRALLDSYAKKRYVSDQALEKEALDVLSHARELGADAAMREARAVLNRTFHEPCAEDMRFRMQEISQQLFAADGCRMQQSSVMHNAQRWIRGAWLDTLNMPLNDTQFFVTSFEEILQLTDEEEKLAAIDALLHRTDAGKDGKYIALGRLADFKRYVVPGKPYEEDPGMLRSPHLFHDLYGLMMNFHGNHRWHNEYPIPLAWVNRARTIYGTPLKVRVDGLVPGARYSLSVTYPDMLGQGREAVQPIQYCGSRADSECVRRDGAPDMTRMQQKAVKIALYAGDTLIHDVVRRDSGVSHDPVYTYALPNPVPEDGVVELTWQAYDTLYPVAVAELWLRRMD